MKKFLLQRGLLIYILAPESCDSYPIFYNNYVLAYLYLFVCINRSHVCDVLRLMVLGLILRLKGLIDGRC